MFQSRIHAGVTNMGRKCRNFDDRIKIGAAKNNARIDGCRTQSHEHFFTCVNTDAGSADNIFEGTLIDHLAGTPEALKISGILAQHQRAS